MKCNCSNFLLGMGIGSAIGTLAYHFSHTARAKKLEKCICHTLHDVCCDAEACVCAAEGKEVDDQQ